jgi:hypothetical protein
MIIKFSPTKFIYSFLYLNSYSVHHPPVKIPEASANWGFEDKFHIHWNNVLITVFYVFLVQTFRKDLGRQCIPNWLVTRISQNYSAPNFYVNEILNLYCLLSLQFEFQKVRYLVTWYTT